MDSIARLVAEHDLIRRTLDAFERCVASLQTSPTPDAVRADLASFVSFFREFAEHEHHAKEESVLFAAVTDAHLPDNDEVVKSLLSEHETGRRYLLRLNELVSRQGSWSADHVQDAIREARSYALFMRSHIREEDGILFPLVQRCLPPALLTQLGHGLDRFEASPERRQARDRLYALSDALTRKYA